MDLKHLWNDILKYPVLFAALGVLSISVVFSQCYLIMVNEQSCFRIAIALFAAALIYLFVIWISVNDFPYQGMCGFIAVELIIAGIADSLITPDWLINAHWLNKYAVFSTNMIATISALSFLWTKVVTFLYGPPSRAMPITERHEGFVYVCFNSILAAILALVPSFIDSIALFSIRKTMINRSWIFILVSLVFDFFVGYIVGNNRGKYKDTIAAADNVVVDVE